MLATTGADIALMNGGGIRDSIPAGDITKKQVYTVLPFGNYLWTTTLTGDELKKVLENGVSKLPAIDGRYPHLAGATFTFDVAQPVGSRVTGITVGGNPVDPAKKYTLVTLNFEMNGGDEYTMLKGRAYKEFPLDADSFMAYLQKLGTVTEDNIVYKK
jgi:5'-nucleotidase